MSQLGGDWSSSFKECLPPLCPMVYFSVMSLLLGMGPWACEERESKNRHRRAIEHSEFIWRFRVEKKGRRMQRRSCRESNREPFFCEGVGSSPGKGGRWQVASGRWHASGGAHSMLGARLGCSVRQDCLGGGAWLSHSNGLGVEFGPLSPPHGSQPVWATMLPVFSLHIRQQLRWDV